MPINLAAIGITSQQEADELERDLGVRFDDFTPEDCDTWILQTIYLDQFYRTRAVSVAADNTGVSIRTARQWQVENTLGFNNRLEIAVLRYTDVLEVMLLQRAQEPDSPPSLLMMLLRAHMPEKYGSARRSTIPRDGSPSNHHCDHDPQPNSTSQYDRELLEEIFRDLQNLKQFAGLTEPSDLSPAGGENPAYSNLSPAGGETQRGGAPTPTDQPPAGPGFKPAHDPSTPSVASPPTPSPVLGEGWGEGPAPSTQNPDPNLSPAGEENPAHSDLSPAGEETQRGGIPTPTDQPPAGADPKPAHDPSTHSEASPPPPSPVLGESLPRTRYGGWGEGPTPTTQNPEPALNRRQRRELQRRAKRQKSHLARAPN